MCRVADHWGAEYCLEACLARLNELVGWNSTCNELCELLRDLPKSVQQLPQHAAWQEKVNGILVNSANADDTIAGCTAYLLFSLFADVHALLTSPAKLQHFRQLPYAAVKAWASSDELVVDSENSVVVALGSWVSAHKKCITSVQKKELSSLIRVKHLTPSRYPSAVTAVASPKGVHDAGQKC
jgi:hypothetical protein